MAKRTVSFDLDETVVARVDAIAAAQPFAPSRRSVLASLIVSAVEQYEEAHADHASRGERLRRARESAKMTQDALAAQFKVDRTTVSAWERGTAPMTPQAWMWVQQREAAS